MYLTYLNELLIYFTGIIKIYLTRVSISLAKQIHTNPMKLN